MGHGPSGALSKYATRRDDEAVKHPSVGLLSRAKCAQGIPPKTEIHLDVESQMARRSALLLAVPSLACMSRLCD